MVNFHLLYKIWLKLKGNILFFSGIKIHWKKPLVKSQTFFFDSTIPLDQIIRHGSSDKLGATGSKDVIAVVIQRLNSMGLHFGVRFDIWY